MKNPFLRSLLGSAGLRIVNAGLGFGVAVVLARVLGAEGYGIYSIAFVVASVCAIVVQFGLPNLVMRETATSAASEDWEEMRAVWSWAGRMAMMFSTIVLAVGAMVLFLMRAGLETEKVWTFGLSLGLVPLLAFAALRAGALRGLQHVVLAQVPDMIVKPGVMFLLVLTLGLLFPTTAPVAMAMQLCAVGVTLAFSSLFLLRKTPENLVCVSYPRNFSHIHNWGKSTLLMAVTAAAGQIYLYADILVLSVFSSSESVGEYRVAYQFALLASFPNAIIFAIAGPKFAELKSLNEVERLEGYLSRLIILAALPTVGIFVFYCFFGAHITNLIFGQEYANSYVPTLLLMGVHVSNAIFGPLGLFLSMTGQEKNSAILHFAAALLGLVLNTLFVQWWGVVGIASATLVSYTVLNLGLFLNVRQYVLKFAW